MKETANIDIGLFSIFIDDFSSYNVFFLLPREIQENFVSPKLLHNTPIKYCNYDGLYSNNFTNTKEIYRLFISK